MDSEPSDDAFREVFEQLPSGVEVSVAIDSPQSGAVFSPGPVGVSGTATIGETAPIAAANLIYLLDVSGSTGDRGGCGGDQNGDGNIDTVLDCEIAAVLEVNELAASMDSIHYVGAGVFGSRGAAADVIPGAGDQDPLTEPDADLNGNTTLDMHEVLGSLRYGGIEQFFPANVGTKTSYGAGLQAIVPILAAGVEPNNVVIMVSDGKNGEAPAVADVIPELPAGTVVHAFAVGFNSSCDAGNAFGSLRDIADATAGSCTEVPDVADLPHVLPEVIAAQMSGLALTVDGVLATIDSVSQPLPIAGAATVDYSTTLHDLGPGEHQLCAHATGVDALGDATATECVTIRIGSDPVVECQDIVLVADDTCTADASIEGAAFDPDGDPLDCTITPPGPYPIGVTQVSMSCVDGTGAVSSCDATVEVIDETPAEATPADNLKLWPPDHKSHEFSVSDCFEQITDSCAGPDFDPYADLEFEIVALMSDEHEDDLADGNTCLDTIMITSPTTFAVRSERQGKSNGRCYEAVYRITDALGNESYSTCEVTVSQANKKNAVPDPCALCLDADPDDGDYCATLNDGAGCPSPDQVCK